MNAKDAIWLLDKQGSCDALHGNEEIVYRALRLLAAAEGGEGTPETDALHHRLVKASEGPQWIAGKDYCDMKDHARTLEQRCNALAARVRELEEEAARWDAMIAAQERVASNERPPKMATEFVRELANMVQRDGALLPRMQIAGHYRSLASALDENARLAARVRELEAQVRIAAGMLSTCPGFSDKHPQVALDAIEIAARSK